MAVNKVPYKASWVDNFSDWLSGLPIPYWISLLFIYLLVIFSIHAAAWIDGALSFGEIDPYAFFDSLWLVMPLFFLLTLDRVANQALDKFAKLVPGKKREVEDIRYRMTTIPAGVVLIINLLMALIFVSEFYANTGFQLERMQYPASEILTVVIATVSYAFGPVLFVHAIRQLNLVTKAYRLVGELNLFHLQPLYAFSSLTLTSSLFWILILNMNFFGNFVLRSADFTASSTDIVFAVVFSAAFILLTFITFLLPLWPIHRRIQNKKESALEENGQQIEKAHTTLYRHLKKNDYKKGNDLEKSLSSLYKMREQIEKVPTWPWSPGTFRNFLSAIFLPLALWGVQQLLLRIL